jgi:hypothetical protein
MRAQQTRPNLRQAKDTLIARGVAHRLAQWGLGGLLALILVVAHAPGGWAAIELREFTATTQEDGTILLRWITRTELDTSFFRIYRSETATGPWDTVVTELDSNSDGVTDTVYEYNDTDIAVGTTYFYLLEEVEVASSGGVNRYVDFIRSATAGQPGAPTSTPTATPTATPTVTRTSTPGTSGTPGASPTPSQTPNQTPSPTPGPTATRVDAATATRTPNETPTPTVQPSATPTLQSSPQPTAAAPAAAPVGTPGAATATPLPAGRVATPTGQAGVNPLPTTVATPRPSGATPARPGDASATAPATALAQPAPTATLYLQRTPTATSSPAVFASKPTEPAAPRSAAPRPILATAQPEAAPRNDGWILALGGGAVILAGLLGGIALFLWRRHHS